MSNKYSYAQVLSCYQSHGLNQFDSVRQSRSQSPVASYKSRSSVPSTHHNPTSRTPQSRSSSRIRIDSPSPSPPSRRNREPCQVHSSSSSLDTAIHVPESSRTLQGIFHQQGPHEKPQDHVDVRNWQASDQDVKQRNERKGTDGKQTEQPERFPVVQESSKTDDRCLVGLEGHGTQSLLSIRQARNTSRKLSSDTAIFVPRPSAKPPAINVHASNAATASFLLKNPLTPPLTPQNVDGFMQDEARDATPPPVLVRMPTGAYTPGRSPATPISIRTPPKSSGQDFVSFETPRPGTSVGSSSKRSSQAFSISSHTSSGDATTPTRSKSVFSDFSTGPPSPRSSARPDSSKSQATFDLSEGVEPPSLPGGIPVRSESVSSESTTCTSSPKSVDRPASLKSQDTFDDLYGELESLPSELPSELDLFDSEMPLPEPDDEGFFWESPASNKPINARLMYLEPPTLYASRYTSFDSAAPPPISLNRSDTTRPINRIKRLVPFLHKKSNTPTKPSPLAPVDTAQSTPPMPADTTPKTPKRQASKLQRRRPGPITLPTLFPFPSFIKPYPKSIPYASTTPGSEPAQVAVSRTAAPSIPALFPDHQGHWPPHAYPGTVDIGDGIRVDIGSREALEAGIGGRSRSRASSLTERARSLVSNAPTANDLTGKTRPWPSRRSSVDSQHNPDFGAEEDWSRGRRAVNHNGGRSHGWISRSSSVGSRYETASTDIEEDWDRGRRARNASTGRSRRWSLRRSSVGSQQKPAFDAEEEWNRGRRAGNPGRGKSGPWSLRRKSIGSQHTPVFDAEDDWDWNRRHHNMNSHGPQPRQSGRTNIGNRAWEYEETTTAFDREYWDWGGGDREITDRERRRRWSWYEG